MRLGFSRQIFENYPNIKFHENPSSRSRVGPCGQRDGRADRTKLIVAFRNFANSPDSLNRVSCVRLRTVNIPAMTTRWIPVSLSSGYKRRFALVSESQHSDVDSLSDLRDRITCAQTVSCQQNQHDLQSGTHLSPFLQSARSG